ncbi:hypothetical protein DEO72_LG6g769 [Vigna unguiculata]|uniref:Uncharacterized protein n=1 Tax=Vigna unguiculata TaxID=3917 RepID=A0A4D6M5F7_VIGUN|nr:hypothetical protein DEO72_LG6g769 [Vigna unguiculata]
MAAVAAISLPATTNLQQRRRHHLPPSNRDHLLRVFEPPFQQFCAATAPPCHLHRSCSSAATVLATIVHHFCGHHAPPSARTSAVTHSATFCAATATAGH